MKTPLIGTSAVVIALLLAGCAADEPGAITLAATKSTAQLQRNTISGQIGDDITASVTRVSDASEACDGDATRHMRLWRSTALIELVPEAADQISTIQRSISGTFVAKGWGTSSEVISKDTTLVTLTNPNSLATIELTAVTNVDGIGMGANLYVNIAGPCVKTDGPGSAELKQLGE